MAYFRATIVTAAGAVGTALRVSLALSLLAARAWPEVIPVDHRETIQIRVLDGRTGRPIPHVRLILIAGYTGRDLDRRLWREEAATDLRGQARLPRALANFPFLRITLHEARQCPGQGKTPFHVAQIRSEGVSAPNHCGLFQIEDTAGMLTLFARGPDRLGPSSVQEEPARTAPAEEPVNFLAGADPGETPAEDEIRGLRAHTPDPPLNLRIGNEGISDTGGFDPGTVLPLDAYDEMCFPQR